MGTFVWLYSPRTNSPHITMNSFVVFATLLAAACAAPQTVVNTVNQGPQTGPLTPIIGDLVATPKGYRSLALEGFSEDLNQDGFVDPIAQLSSLSSTPPLLPLTTLTVLPLSSRCPSALVRSPPLLSTPTPSPPPLLSTPLFVVIQMEV